jgi:hypothetical protein
MEIIVRPERPGDGEGLARVWLDNARYHAELAPDLFRVPDEDGLAEWMEPRSRPVSVPFYEERLGYTRRQIVFSKRLN